jgi:hypothetical protein
MSERLQRQIIASGIFVVLACVMIGVWYLENIAEVV